ncbi:MAG TPA: hypothetical protein VMV77_21330 [Bacteroidales bacterium]|nr:hypothetical protein [Bacteroidales bacterium]
MSIVSINMLSDRIPGTSDGTDLLNAVNRATSFVNTWTSKVYDPWEDFQASPELLLAPQVIGEICIEVAEAMYYMLIGQIQRDGEGNDLWRQLLDDKKEELQNIDVNPEWKSQAISLDSNKRMVVGTRNTVTGVYPRVIPFNANVISGAGNNWNRGTDYYVRQGGINRDENSDAWYFDAQSSSLEGTLNYLRTYRKDTKDYMTYSRA